MRTPLLSFVLAALLGLVLLPALLLPRSAPVQAQRPTPGRPTPAGRQSQCAGSVAVASSLTETVRLCDTITNTVTVAPECLFCMGGVSIVFVRPELAGADIWMRQTTDSMINELERYQREFERDHNRPFLIQGGVVSYDADRARPLQAMTSQLPRVKSAVQRVMYGVQDGGPYPDAAQQAVQLLRAAERSDETNGYPPCMEVVVFFGSFEGATGDRMQLTADVLRAKAIIEARTRLLFVGCTGEDTLGGCGFFLYMQPNYARAGTRFENRSKFANVMVKDFRDIEEEHKAKPPELLRSISLVQQLPVGLTYVAGSGQPAPSAVITAAGETTLRWDWDPARQLDPRVVRYAARPDALGAHTIAGWADIEDLQGLDRRLPMASLAVSVTDPCAPPTATPTRVPTATPTPEPSATPLPASPSPTPSPTATQTRTPLPSPTPKPAPVYLPIALGERCAPDRRRVDVVLVLDASTSMGVSITGELTKIDAARVAARAFVAELDFEHGDQAAIVAFNAEARLMQPLTSDREALLAAIADIQLAQQTCLVCAVTQADEELAGPRHLADNQPAMILLTDGRSNPQPVEAAVDRARVARARGVVIFTIGLGEDLDADALLSMASRPEYAFRVADPATLEAIYRSVARDIPCPPAAYWGRR